MLHKCYINKQKAPQISPKSSKTSTFHTPQKIKSVLPVGGCHFTSLEHRFTILNTFEESFTPSNKRTPKSQATSTRDQQTPRKEETDKPPKPEQKSVRRVVDCHFVKPQAVPSFSRFFKRTPKIPQDFQKNRNLSKHPPENTTLQATISPLKKKCGTLIPFITITKPRTPHIKKQAPPCLVPRIARTKASG